MKPKSFKSKELGEQTMAILEQDPIALYTFDVAQKIAIRDFSVGVTFDDDWGERVAGTRRLATSGIALGDILTLTIDSDPQVLLARVENVVQLGKTRQFILAEHNKQPLGSSKSKQTPSLPWISFLKELKKKCGSGHHNKKKKTLLHVVRVRVAKALGARPERIKLTVRAPLEEVLGNAQAIEDRVSQIQDAIAEAESEGDSVSLNDIIEFFPEEPEVVEVNYTPQMEPGFATTHMMNGVYLRRVLVGSKETISIPIANLDNAVKFSTGDQFIPIANLDNVVKFSTGDQFSTGDPLSLFDPEVIWVFTAYGHDQDVTTHDNRAVKKISMSQDGRHYNLELQVGLEAGALWPDNKNDYHLVVLSGYKPVADEAVEEWEESELEKKNDEMLLAIKPDMYEFLPKSNDGYVPLQINHPLGRETLSRFEEGRRYLASVGNTHVAVRVTNVTIDDVKKIATVDFGYEGDPIDQSPYAQQTEELIMSRVSEVFTAKDAAITLTLEKEEGSRVDVGADPAADGDDGGPDLAEIADGIKERLVGYPEGDVSLIEVADWLAEKELPGLMVTGAGYVAQRQAYETSISVSGGLGIEAWTSKDGNYKILDIIDIENVKSLVNRSLLAEDAQTHHLREINEQMLVTHLDELREIGLGVVPVPDDESLARYGNVSIYSRGKLFSGEKGGYAVCNNEQIWRVLRKKKDGKCIYRIVMKKGVRANRMAYGKHEKCVMYIHRYTSVDSMPAD
jgi:hypothetical protein